MKNSRYSKAREAIRISLASRNDHPSALDIYDDLKVSFPHLSLGTVYRNLHQLAEAQRIREVDVGEDKKRFDARLDPHSHFFCERCHQVLDIDLDIRNDLQVKAPHHKIRGYALVLKGICADCLKKEIEEEKNEIT